MVGRGIVAALAVSLLLACGGSGESKELEAPAALQNVTVIGASVSAGFGGGDSGGRATLPLADVIDAAIVGRHGRVRSVADVMAFADQDGYVKRALPLALAAKRPPTALVAIDLLFWCIHGLGTAAQKQASLAATLQKLEAFSGPILLGDVPDVAPALQSEAPMITADMLPPPALRDAANATIAAWAAAHRNVVLVPFAALVAKVHAGGPIELRGTAWRGGDVARLLQRDLLHPTLEGSVAVWLAIVDAWLAADPALPPAAFALDGAKLAAALAPKLASDAAASADDPAAAPAGR